MNPTILALLVILSHAGLYPKSFMPPERLTLATLASSQPLDLHEWAMRRLKVYADYRKAQDNIWKTRFPQFASSLSRDTEYRISYWVNGATSSFEVSANGELSFDHMTAEDALLILVADKLDQTLETARELDQREAERQAALTDIPPTRFKADGATWPILNIPQYDADPNVLASTNCYGKWIKIKEDGADKPISLMHELLHVATKCDNNPRVHETIYGLAPSLLRILRDNPDVVKYLTAKP